MKTAFAALVCLCALCPVAHAGDFVAISGPLTREFDVQPGRSYDGTIDVANPSKAAQEIKVYQTDYLFYADGTRSYGEPGSIQRSNARWLTLSPLQAVIPAGESVTIRFAVQVPSDQTLRGSYWSVIMVEPVPPSAPESSRNDSPMPALGIRQVVRYAVQVITTVADTGSRQIRFSQVRLVSDNGRRQLVVDLENTGERLLRTSLWADLYDPKGSFVGKFDGGKHGLYPGTSARFTADLAGLAIATYKALIVADCGGDDVFGANVSLVLTE